MGYSVYTYGKQPVSFKTKKDAIAYCYRYFINHPYSKTFLDIANDTKYPGWVGEVLPGKLLYPKEKGVIYRKLPIVSNDYETRKQVMSDGTLKPIKRT